MASRERTVYMVNSDKVSEVRAMRLAMFPSDEVDAAYITYLELLSGSKFDKISSQARLMTELGKAVHALDVLIQVYGEQAYEMGGEYEGPVHELSLESPDENALFVARSTSRIVLADRLPGVSFSLSNTDSYFSIAKIPSQVHRINTTTPMMRAFNLRFRPGEEGSRSVVVNKGIIGEDRLRYMIGEGESPTDARHGGILFAKIVKEDFKRTMPHS